LIVNINKLGSFLIISALVYPIKKPPRPRQ
jgi:hypothetical protein